jgi:hypothetical protein
VGEGVARRAMREDTESTSVESLLLDPSLLSVVLSNVLSIVLALVFDWDLNEILWVYWGQSVVIGVTNFIRMMRLKEFTTRGLKSGGRAVPETQKAKRETAFFFLIHYGFFHLVYAVFLSQRMPLNLLSQQDATFLLIAIGGFAFTHGYSLIHNAGDDFRHKKPNLGTLLFYPYMRVMPMHLTILAGAATGGGAVTAFMILKTIADAGMHMVEHALFRRT